MIKRILWALIIISAMLLPAQAEEHSKKHVIDLRTEAAIGNMSSIISLHGSIYMAGQPDPATLSTLKDQGFEVVINIRGQDELNFDEPALLTGLVYYNIPLLKDGKIQDAAVVDIHTALTENKGKKILLHCSSGNRVAGWLGAHLGRDLGYTTDNAVVLAKQAGMTKASMEQILRDYLNHLAK